MDVRLGRSVTFVAGGYGRDQAMECFVWNELLVSSGAALLGHRVQALANRLDVVAEVIEAR